MRFAIKVLAVCATFAMMSAPAASFDCTQAQSPMEKAICSSPRLSALDSELGLLYGKLLGYYKGDASIKSSQRDRLKKKRDACPDTSCVASAYEERILAYRTAASRLDVDVFGIVSNVSEEAPSAASAAPVAVTLVAVEPTVAAPAADVAPAASGPITPPATVAASPEPPPQRANDGFILLAALAIAVLAWVGTAVVSSKRGWPKVVGIGGGGILGVVTVVAIAGVATQQEPVNRPALTPFGPRTEVAVAPAAPQAPKAPADSDPWGKLSTDQQKTACVTFTGFALSMLKDIGAGKAPGAAIEEHAAKAEEVMRAGDRPLKNAAHVIGFMVRGVGNERDKMYQTQRHMGDDNFAVLLFVGCLRPEQRQAGGSPSTKDVVVAQGAPVGTVGPAQRQPQMDADSVCNFGSNMMIERVEGLQSRDPSSGQLVRSTIKQVSGGYAQSDRIDEIWVAMVKEVENSPSEHVMNYQRYGRGAYQQSWKSACMKLASNAGMR
jgi:uncharacterized protein